MAQSCNGLISVLGKDGDNILLRSNGTKTSFDELDKKIIGLYFAASSCLMCQDFTPILIKSYHDLVPKYDFEIILISSDKDEDSFYAHFSTMPWLSIPYSNKTVRDDLKNLYAAEGSPRLIILNEKGDVLNGMAHYLVYEFGSLAYPFTTERIKQLKDGEDIRKKNQTLETVLATDSRDYLISNDGKEVPISELEGKIVGLYISLGSFRACQNFTPKLIQLYKGLKDKGESFELVLVSLDHNKETFQNEFMKMPWLAIPFADNALKTLPRYFELSAIPTLVILGRDGKTLQLNVRRYVAEFGIQAYPFSTEKVTELEEVKKAKSDSQTLESLLVSDELDFVIGKGSTKVPVSELVGKTVLFYFSRLQCPPCRAFTPKLAKIYNEIKAKHSDFEVIFVSLDNEEKSFREYNSEMPWLALPYNDKRETLLTLTFQSSGIPHLSAVGPSGKTLTNQAKDLVLFFGSDAYPFTDDRKKEMDQRLEEMAKGWPEKVRNKKHPYHDLVRSLRGVYHCGGCNEMMVGWVFSCDVCEHFHLHPECALMTESVSSTDYSEKQVKVDDDDSAHDPGNSDNAEGWICDGEVCYKA